MQAVSCMQSMMFYLNISADQYQRYYKGTAKNVIVTTLDGKTLQFPVSALHKFIGHEGVKGKFRIQFDTNNKLQKLEKIE